MRTAEFSELQRLRLIQTHSEIRKYVLARSLVTDFPLAGKLDVLNLLKLKGNFSVK